MTFEAEASVCWGFSKPELEGETWIWYAVAVAMTECRPWARVV